MMRIRTFVAQSKILGRGELGLFAAQHIRANTIAWSYVTRLDRMITSDQLGALTIVEQEFVKKYAYLCGVHRKWVLCADDARFMNHSYQPNLVSGASTLIDIAARDISIGEELTCDYSTFDVDFRRKLGADKL